VPEVNFDKERVRLTICEGIAKREGQLNVLVMVEKVEEERESPAAVKGREKRGADRVIVFHVIDVK
jgi:hypothetical protein